MRKYSWIWSIDKELLPFSLFLRWEIGVVFDDIVDVGDTLDGRGDRLDKVCGGVVFIDWMATEGPGRTQVEGRAKKEFCKHFFFLKEMTKFNLF